MKKLFTLLFVFALASVILATAALGYTRNKMVDEAGSWLAGRPIAVRCYTEGESQADFFFNIGVLGYVWSYQVKGVWYPQPVANLRYDICSLLEKVAVEGAQAVAPETIAVALLILTHESRHTAGYRNEAKVECWAIRHVGGAAERFGYYGDAKMRIVRTAVEFHWTLHTSYLLQGCQVPSP